MKKFLVSIVALALCTTAIATLPENEPNQAATISFLRALLGHHPSSTLVTTSQQTDESALAHEQTPVLRSGILTANFSQRIHNILPTTITPRAIMQESSQASTELKKFVKTHPTFSGAVALSLMGTKRASASVRFMARQPLLLILASVAILGTKQTILYLDKGYQTVRPLIAHAQLIYDSAFQHRDTLPHATEPQA